MKIAKLKINFGFTLIELLIVVAILGVLATVVFMRLIGAETGARDARRLSDVKQFQTAIEAFRSDHDGYLPSRNSVQPLSAYCTDTDLVPCPDDPQAPTNVYRFITNGTGAGNLDATDYVLWAKLEKPTVDTWFVVCANTQSGEVTAEPATYACPL